ncbi:SDR family NAD(P)-dependent oxidoreductase [Paenibacillus sp. FSL R10-2736]|uniref:SDR family NAD(P)-dependent oxidoreductase n=1 Tax=Paenibacillus sp. FSL R10-2736 TaxID=2954692 RepID=UPI0030F5258F
MKQTVLITGATGGIGYELAEVFAENNNNLVLIARNQTRLLEIKQLFEKKYKIKVFILGKDLSEKDAAVEIYQTIKQQKITVNVLVNNAGFGDFGEFHKTDWQKQYEMVQVNIIALMQLTRLFVPEMISLNHGKIMNVASTAAFPPGPWMSVYYASKAFVLSFSESIAQELKHTEVAVTVLCPGPTETGFVEKADLNDSKLFKSNNIADAKSVAVYGYKKLNKKVIIAIPGLGNKITAWGQRFVPRSLVRKIMYKKQAPIR